MRAGAMTTVHHRQGSVALATDPGVANGLATPPPPLRVVKEHAGVVVVGAELAAALGYRVRDGDRPVEVFEDVPAEEILAHHVYADPALLEAAGVRPRSLTKSPLTIVDPANGAAADPLPRWARAVKRAVDIAVSAAALVVLALPMLVLAVLVRRDSPGGSLFRQDRVGTDGRVFPMVKFRTMAADNDHSDHQRYREAFIEGRAERQGRLYKDAADPRVTRFGARLRAWSLDELPQFWNVLKGDMSLIGPRPCLPYEADRFDAISWERLRVKPGITGLWQVSGRSSLSHAQAIELDVQYWRDWNVATELRIFLRTPMAILAKSGV